MRFKMMALAAAVSFTLPAIGADGRFGHAATPKKEKKICRRARPDRIDPRRRAPICHTKAEWAADRRRRNAQQCRHDSLRR